MKKINEKKLEKIKEFMELAEKHNKEVNIELSIYSTSSIDIIKEANKLFKGRLRKEYKESEGAKWIRLHNAPKGKKALDGDLIISIFYPRN